METKTLFALLQGDKSFTFSDVRSVDVNDSTLTVHLVSGQSIVFQCFDRNDFSVCEDCEVAR